MSEEKKNSIADKKMIVRAMKDSRMFGTGSSDKNPVMFLVYVSAILTSILFVASLFGIKDVSSGYTFGIAVILWFTVLFANFAEAIAEGSRKGSGGFASFGQKDVPAHKIQSADKKDKFEVISSALLKKGDIVIVNAGDQMRLQMAK